MNRSSSTFAAALLLVLPLAVPPSDQSAGAIVAVGGGGTTGPIVARVLELAGGREANVVVLPQSSALADAGDSSVKMWLDAGAGAAVKVSFADAGARAALERATLIWIPGGDQNRFMKAITGTGLDDVIRARHRAGTIVGGTSAGAAVLSGKMMTGDADLQSLTAGKTMLAPGLGLLPDVIVDQHFLRRQRNNRLLSAVLDDPAMVGVGIDEATAAIFHNGAIEVIGRSAVVVYDARYARVERTAPGSVPAASGILTAVLRHGTTFRISSPPSR